MNGVMSLGETSTLQLGSPGRVSSLPEAIPTRTAEINLQLQRESKGCFSVIFYSSIFIMMDLWRQVCAYGMKYYNDNTYPVPQTELVVISEVSKLCIFLCKMSVMGTLCNINVSFSYLIPSVTYAINNNIYFFALNYTTPPVWNILCQLRVVFTALVYRFFFKRTFSLIQWVGLCLLITAIVLAKFSGEQQGRDSVGKSDMLIAFCMAVVASGIAAVGPIYTEVRILLSPLPFSSSLFSFSFL